MRFPGHKRAWLGIGFALTAALAGCGNSASTEVGAGDVAAGDVAAGGVVAGEIASNETAVGQPEPSVESQPAVVGGSPPVEAAELAPGAQDVAKAKALGLTAAQVVRVTDGDTIVAIVNGIEERVRLIGIDTPERGTTGFAEATAFTQGAIDGVAGRVYLAADGADRDRFDRLRRDVWLGVPDSLDSQREELLLNQMLLDAGHAVVWGSGASATAAPGADNAEVTTDVPARFRNCAQVWEVLGRPIRAGERGFHSGLVRDGDGVGCENPPR